jgi:3-phenylpropionate/trans-cinnamate dioxygenase ferredoxin reductase subunit/anthranilate 1,2-dioxygenase ferredoxin reductase subunit
MERVVVIGAGVAGHRAAEEIVKLASDFRVTVLQDENSNPYDRPPLSKEFLASSEIAPPLLSGQYIQSAAVDFRANVRVEHIDRQQQAVTGSDGRRYSYDRLLLATGSRSRLLPLPAAINHHVHYLRTLRDAQRLREALQPDRRIAIIGGGFIGLEVSVAARRRGCSTVVFEKAPFILERVGSRRLSDWLSQLHASDDCEMEVNCGPLAIEDAGERVALKWNAGEALFDAVVVGIGVEPNTALAIDAGLHVDDGIVVDHECRTSDPNVFAAGEVTSYPLRSLARRIRSESWSVAIAQAQVAARNIAGIASDYDELPWLWSDQCDANIQCLGMNAHAAFHASLRSDSPEKWLDVGFDQAGKVVSAVAVNMGREMSMLRRSLKRKEPVPAAIASRLEPSQLAIMGHDRTEGELRGMSG